MPHKQLHQFHLLWILTFIVCTVSMESSICFPALPQIAKAMGVSGDQVQIVMSSNFFGLALGCIVAGTISDIYGRINLILTSLVLFCVFTAMCPFSESLYSLGIWRFLQGFAAAFPMIISPSIITSQYDTQRSAQILTFLNMFITFVLTLAPAVGEVLVAYYSWKSIFYFTGVMGVLSLFVSLLLIRVGQAQPKRSFHIREVYALGMSFFHNRQFLRYCLAWAATCSIFNIYFSCLPFLLDEFFGDTNTPLGVWQGSVMGTFFVACFIGSFLIKRKGAEKVEFAGRALSLLSLLPLGVSLVKGSFILLHSSLIIFAISNAFLIGVLVAKALQDVKEFQGTGISLMQGSRFIIMSLALSVISMSSSFLFINTVVICAIIIFAQLCLVQIQFYKLAKNS
jgi:DHA1 family bicyclomycin/chloramphenicol resistance-like MFS transporter